MSAPWYRIRDRTLVLDVRVQPGAASDEVAGAYGDRLKIRVAARPVDDAANSRLTSFLADAFGVPKSRVRLASGRSRREKRVLIEQPGRMPDWLDGNRR